MIPANKNPFLDSLLYWYFRRLLGSRFAGVHVRGLAHYRNLPRDRPALCFAHHTNWWDGLVAYFLTRFNQDKASYCMMEEKQLKHYRFFSWMGAFSVDLTSPMRAAASLRYAVEKLQDQETLIWIFPQGRMEPPSLPVVVKEGTSFLSNKAVHAALLPVAMRYEFFGEDRPALLIEIGKPYAGPRPISDESIQTTLQETVNTLDVAVRAHDLTGFEQIVSPKLSINKRWEWFVLACRGRLKEFRAVNG